MQAGKGWAPLGHPGSTQPSLNLNIFPWVRRLLLPVLLLAGIALARQSETKAYPAPEFPKNVRWLDKEAPNGLDSTCAEPLQSRLSNG